MTIQVLFFALLREKMKCSQANYEVSPQETVGMLAQRILETIPETLPIKNSLLFAVNQSYVPQNHILREGDEVALIPPVSGG